MCVMISLSLIRSMTCSDEVVGWQVSEPILVIESREVLARVRVSKKVIFILSR